MEPSPTTGLQHCIPPLFHSSAARKAVQKPLPSVLVEAQRRHEDAAPGVESPEVSEGLEQLSKQRRDAQSASGQGIGFIQVCQEPAWQAPAVADSLQRPGPPANALRLQGGGSCRMVQRVHGTAAASPALHAP